MGYADAFRKQLVAVLQSVDEQGEVRFGFRHPGKAFPELGLHALIAVEADLLYTGDTSVARAHRGAIQRLLAYGDKWLQDDLFWIPREQLAAASSCPNWYYDGVHAGGFMLYHSLWTYRAMGAAQTVFTALGEPDKVRALAERRARIKDAINRRFWRDDAYGPGRGGYLDWSLDQDFKDVRAYFFAPMQYMPIVFGVADNRQTRAILATADHFLAGLRRDQGYTREGTLDNLLPIPPQDVVGGRKFGMYMNGGMLLAMTFWEVTARAVGGDAAGAQELLSRFAAHARRTNWYEGENAFSMDGKPLGWSYEPYLADQIAAAASLVHGFLGLQYTWDDFTVTPHLPPGWDSDVGGTPVQGPPLPRHCAGRRQVAQRRSPLNRARSSA